MSKSLEGVLVKPAHKKQAFTNDQLDEFVKCADPVTGPAYFLDHYFNIQHFMYVIIHFQAILYIMYVY